MKFIFYFLFSFGTICFVQAQLCGCVENTPHDVRTISTRAGSAQALYSDLRTWIPDLSPSEPLKNPPLTYIEVTFHVFFDNEGGNNSYTNTPYGRSRLIALLDHVNKTYSGYFGGSSDPVPGVVDLPGYDTRIRFTLGDNHERIYFYNSTSLNKTASSFTLSNFINQYYPERSNKINVFFTAGYSAGASGLANFSDSDLSRDLHVIICHCHDVQDNIVKMVLAHEFGHNLSLLHTHCGGGASAIPCSGVCLTGTCPPGADCNPEYLTDIFGPCPGTCPHIVRWDDPFDNTLPDADRHTNNLMGETSKEHYLSPMQAGQMHRTLAIYTAQKYVKKETYSPIPLVINASQVWDFNLKLYRDIVISPQAVLTLANTFEFPYNGTITVSGNSALVIEGSVKLTDNNKIIVQNGGTLKFTQGSSLEITGNGQIEVNSGGFLCIPFGASIRLTDSNSCIYLKSGYRSGVNTSIVPPVNNCYPDLIYFPISGNGQITELGDIYIQNETISTNRNYSGNNIYAGSDVTSAKPRGSVIITNNASVIMNASESVYLAPGFECRLGSTLEVLK